VRIKAKKSLGQNFLVDKNILEKISNSCEINKNTEILEIGPGTGNLTDYLYKKKPNKIYLVEKDKNLVNILKDKFKDEIDIFNEDILNFNKKNIFSKNLLIFGNLPYNISSQILVKLIINKEKYEYKKLIFMFQKELADRIISNVNSKNYGRLSILANWKFDIKKLMDINPTCFFPKPKVKSSLLIFTPKVKIFKLKNPESLEHVTKVFFSQRRKKIKKPFNILFNKNLEIADKLKLNLDLRPQNITHELFYKITEEFENLIQ